MSETNAPIIVIKRVKKGGHGHHGGAWKVALADFVTAMMAFFMLLWLVGSTTPEQKAGISDYFQNPTAIDGVTGVSISAIDLGGGMIATTSSDHVPDPDAPLDDNSKQLDIEAEARALEYKKLEELKEQIEAAIDANPEIKQFRDQLLIDIMSDGLRIQIVDKENRSMFDSGSASLKSYTVKILAATVPAIAQVSSKVSLSGHTDQAPYISDDEEYSNWELSVDRANAARRVLVAAGLPEDKIGRVVGLGSSVPYVKDDPLSPINRRISLIVLNKKAEEALTQEAGPALDAPPPPVRRAQHEVAPAPAPGSGSDSRTRPE
jgi:chemotaxis protein MotB